MPNYKLQSYGSVAGRLKDVAYGIRDYVNDMFSSVSELVFGPPMELSPVYDEKMVFDDYARRLGGGSDLKRDYDGLERGVGSNFNFQRSYENKGNHKSEVKDGFQRIYKKSTGKKKDGL